MKTDPGSTTLVYSVDDNTISVRVDDVEVATVDVEAIRWMVELWDEHN